MPTSPRQSDLYGGYRITVITPVCGTGYPGSIPGSRPNININGKALNLGLF
jgi:hypothetical protein